MQSFKRHQLTLQEWLYYSKEWIQTIWRGGGEGFYKPESHYKKQYLCDKHSFFHNLVGMTGNKFCTRPKRRNTQSQPFCHIWSPACSHGIPGCRIILQPLWVWGWGSHMHFVKVDHFVETEILTKCTEETHHEKCEEDKQPMCWVCDFHVAWGNFLDPFGT